MELQSDPKDKNDDRYRDELIESISQYLLNGSEDSTEFPKFSLKTLQHRVNCFII